MLLRPDQTKVIELPFVSLWSDESGIVYCVSKRSVGQTVEQGMEAVAELRRMSGDEKVCMLLDISDSGGTTRELRAYAAEVLPHLLKAVAILSSSVAGKMVANVFFSVKRQPYPVKMFNNERDARAWLKEFL